MYRELIFSWMLSFEIRVLGHKASVEIVKMILNGFIYSAFVDIFHLNVRLFHVKNSLPSSEKRFECVLRPF